MEKGEGQDSSRNDGNDFLAPSSFSASALGFSFAACLSRFGLLSSPNPDRHAFVTWNSKTKPHHKGQKRP